MRTADIDFDSLLEHQGFLRRLALDLIGDEQSAEDLVQETWLAALMRPPRHTRSLRAWLARVLRNRALNRARANRIRDHHDLQLARDRGHTSGEDLDDVFLLHGEVVEEVRKLREPYRRVIYLRYYRELSPREIAVEEDVPLATVRTRLRRGLDELRETLDRRHDGRRALWAAPLSALSGGPTETAVAASATGLALGGSVIMKSVAVSVVIVALGVLCWRFWPERQVSPAGVPLGEDGVELSSEAEPDVVNPAGQSQETGTDRAPSRTPMTARDSGDAVVRGRLIDESGSPVGDVRMSFVRVDRPGTSEGASVAREWEDPDPLLTGADGCFAFHLSLGESVEFIARGELEGHVETAWHRRELDPGQDVDLGTMVLLPAGSLRVRVVDSQGEPVAERDWVVTVKPLEIRAELPREARVFSGDSREGGEVCLRGIPAGMARIEARSRRGSRAGTREIEVREGQERAVSLVYDDDDPRRRIVVNLHWQRDPPFELPASAIRARRPGEEPQIAEQSEGWGGQYYFADLDPGAYTIEIDHPRFVEWRQSGVEPGEEVEAWLEGNAAVRLEVTNGATGEGIDDYELLIDFPTASFHPSHRTLRTRSEPLPADRLYTGLWPTLLPEEIQEADGFPRIPIFPDSFELVVRVPEYPEQRFPVEHLQPGETRMVSAVVLSGAQIEGLVLLSDGSTVAAGAEVMLTRGSVAGHIEDPNMFGAWSDGRERIKIGPVDKRSKTDAEGYFQFENLGPGTWRVRAATSDWVFVDETLELEGGVGGRLSLQLPASGVVFGRLILPRVPGVHKLSLQLLNRGFLRPVHLGDDDPADLVFDEQGLFRSGPLPVGEIQLNAYLCVPTEGGMTGTEVGRERVVVYAGEETECVLDLSGEGLVPLRLQLEIDGEPASEVDFRLIPTDPAHLGYPQLGHRGEVRDGYRHLGLLEPGEWQLVVAAKDGSWAWLRPDWLSVRAGEEALVTERLHLHERELRFVEEGIGEALANCEIAWDVGLPPLRQPLNLQPLRTGGEGRTTLRLPPGDVEFRLVGYAPERLSWPPAGTGELIVELCKGE